MAEEIQPIENNSEQVSTMSEVPPDVFDRNLFLIKEHVGMFKAANNYDILDPESGNVIMECREKNLGFFTKLFRFTDYKRMTPFNVVLQQPSGSELIKVRRGVSILTSNVSVFDHGEELLGGFKQQFFSIGGKFKVHDHAGKDLFVLKGKWTGWDFKFLMQDHEIAQVTKKWSGLGKELFTSADNYVLQIDEKVPAGHPVRKLILASVMCIDMVLKE